MNKKNNAVQQKQKAYSNIVAERHIFGGCDPKFELSPKFHHPTFTPLEVIVLAIKHTHKQTDAAENIHRFSRHYNVG